MLTNLYPPAVSGSSTQSAALSRELARRGCKTVIITAKLSRDSRDYEEVDGVHVYRLPAVILPKTPISLNFPWLNYTFTPKNLKRVENIINIHNPDVLHLHNHMFDLSFSAVLMRKRTKKPLVITIHTVIKHAQKFYNVMLYPADRVFLNHFVIKQAEYLICPDVNIEDYVRDAFGTSRAFLVPYGISLPEVPAEASVEKLRVKYQLNGKRVILSLGHVHEIRNRKDLIEALPFVLNEMPNTVLVIVGTVADSSPVMLAHQLGVQESVVFTSYVPHSQVPAFLAMADLEAHWLNQEAATKTSLGIASLEAMASGKVVIAAANENTYGQGVLRAGENLVLVEPGKPRRLAQTIVGLLGDNGRRAAIGQRGRQTIQKHFSWESVCSKTLDVYSAALRRSAHH